MDDLWDQISGWSPEHWSAVGSVGTLIVAAIAAVFVLVQIRQARKLQEEEAQPNVVVYFDVDRVSAMFINLVVKNLGSTVARDVAFTFEPTLQVAMDDRGVGPDNAGFLRGIPALPPGLEYRMLFDSGPERFERKDLPRRYEATAAYRDRHGRRLEERYILDLDTFYGYSQVRAKNEHHIAKAVEDLAANAKRWTAHNNGIRVYGQDELAYNRRQEERHQQFLVDQAGTTDASSSGADGEITDGDENN